MIDRLIIVNILGALCLAFSVTLLPPIIVADIYHDGAALGFELAFILLAVTGLILWLPFRRRVGRLRRRDGFLVVAIFWIMLGFFSAIPLLIGPEHLGTVDSIFEATSGITTTGATVIENLDHIPPSILFYRQQLQWIGGMGLIVLAIAVLPVLGIGGSQLYRAETPGPMKDDKLMPRLAETARNLWFIYVGLTILCASAYWLAGVGPLDALEHSFATVSTGGFSTHNESIGYFHSETVNMVAVIFMVAGGINFGVHFLAIRTRNPGNYVADVEVRSYLSILLFLILIYTVFLSISHAYATPVAAFEDAAFEITSVMTSTGFGVTDFTGWPLGLPVLLIFIGFIGGCGGSTAGGIKVIRILTLLKQAAHEFFKVLHPKATRPVRVGDRILDERTIQSIWGFFSVYIIVFVLLTLAMMAAGLDQISAFAAVASCINNLGPGLGEVSLNFAHLSNAAKLIAITAMLLGRLEVFTLLIIVTPEFWRS